MSSDPQNTRIPPFGLRMPPVLKARVARAAAENQRSLNAEILATLEEKYPEFRREVWTARLASVLGLDPSNLGEADYREMRAFVDELLRTQDPDVTDDGRPPTVKGSGRGRR